MIESVIENGGWTLARDGKLLLRHTQKRPFATVIRREKTYAADRGTVRETVAETEKHPLAFVRADGENAAILTGGGHALRVEFSECDGGVLLRFYGEAGRAYVFRLPAEKGEAVFGGGEQYRKVDLRGEHVVNFVSEHIKVGALLEKTLRAEKRYRERDHGDIGSYAPMPVFVTDRGRLILFDSDADGISRFQTEEYSFTFDECPRSLTLLQGESYRALSGLLAGRIPNRQYLPGWCHDGMILGIQGGTQTVLDKTFAMLDAGAKVCGVWCQDWCGENRTVMGKQVWWNWEADEGLYPGLRDAIARLQEKGVRFLAYINPYLVKDSRLYNLCRSRGWLITRADGSVYHIKSTTFDAGMIDLTNPEAVTFVKDELIKKNMLDLGVSGWMADFGEYLPVDCVLHTGDPAKMHNAWPVLWARINREAIEEYGDPEVFFFSRAGYLGVQTYAPVMWNGDQHTDFTKDYGMPCVMPASFNLAFSGVTMVHCDVGGFFSFGKLARDEETFIRWMEMCAFSLLMRSHESIRPWANAQFDAPKALPHTVRLTNVHAALRPYLSRVAGEAGQGIPALRPDFWEAGDYGASRDHYSYFLGDDLFVCPVIEKGTRLRRVFLPEGDWVHFWSGTPMAGGREHLAPAALGYPPVFYRKDSEFAALFRTAAERGQAQERED